MKKVLIITTIIIIIILNIIILITWGTPKKEKQLTKKETIEEISKGFINGISKNSLEKLLNQSIDNKTVMTGKDAYLLQKPSEKTIENYNLNKYVKYNEEYYDNLYKVIKNNYTWEFDGKTQNNQNSYFIKIKTYSYGIYLSDIERLCEMLIKNNQSEEPQKVINYKAKVISMKLLDSHLEEYISNENEKTIAITFSNINDDETKNSLMQYLVDLAGYNNHGDNIISLTQNKETRLKNYIDTAMNNNILNKNNILEL